MAEEFAEKSKRIKLSREKSMCLDKVVDMKECPPFLFVCLAPLEKKSEEIQVEFYVGTVDSFKLLPFTVFNMLSPREVSLFPFTKLHRDCSLTFSMISVFSTGSLYCIGGATPAECVTGPFRTLNNYSDKSVNLSELYCYESCIEVDRFHLFKPNRAASVCEFSVPGSLHWSPLPPMIVGRCKPFLLSHQHKIYVFGCTLTPLKDLHPFAEVYDPITDEWTPFIHSIPPLLSDSEPPILFGLQDQPAATNCVFVQNQTEVLVILTNTNISFTWPIESSTDYLTPYSCCPHLYTTNPIVVVDDIAFVAVNSQELYAYRLKNGMFCGYDESPDEPTLVKGLEQQSLGSPTHPSFFFHLDHMDFCMVWQQLNPEIISCLMFHIVKNGDSLEDLAVVVDGFSSYSTEGSSLLLLASM